MARSLRFRPTHGWAITHPASNAGSRSRYSGLEHRPFPLSLGDPFAYWRSAGFSASPALCKCPVGFTFASTVSSYLIGEYFSALERASSRMNGASAFGREVSVEGPAVCGKPGKGMTSGSFGSTISLSVEAISPSSVAKSSSARPPSVGFYHCLYGKLMICFGEGRSTSSQEARSVGKSTNMDRDEEGTR